MSALALEVTVGSLFDIWPAKRKPTIPITTTDNTGTFWSFQSFNFLKLRSWTPGNMAFRRPGNVNHQCIEDTKLADKSVFHRFPMVSCCFYVWSPLVWKAARPLKEEWPEVEKQLSARAFVFWKHQTILHFCILLVNTLDQINLQHFFFAFHFVNWTNTHCQRSKQAKRPKKQ